MELRFKKGMKTETSPLAPPTSNQNGRFARVYEVLHQAITAHAFPGCAFGVLAGGNVVLQDAMGRFTYEDDSPFVNPDTVFDVASITKVASTTAAAMLLHQRGVLDLDLPLGELLPGFVVGRSGGEFAYRVKLRHLLAHNSGLPGYGEFYRTVTTPTALLRACLDLPLEAQPGERAEYSDPGFILLGKAIEVLTGSDLATWVPKEVFGPLQLTATGFNPAESARPAIPPTEIDNTLRHRRIQGEVQDENAWILQGVGGHAGLFSNVPDLLRFAGEILAAGGHQEAAGKPDALKGHDFSRAAIRTESESALAAEGRPWGIPPKTTTSSADSSIFDRKTIDCFAERQGPAGSSRALGWDTPSPDSSAGKLFSPHSIGHLGFSGCSLWIDLDAGVAVVLLTNRTWPDRQTQLIREVRPAFHNAVREAL